MPENTVQSMINGIKAGAQTIEFDCVISKDGKVVVSHDLYMSAEFMKTPEGDTISKQNEKKYNLYLMNYDSIRKYDAGIKPHSRFPKQQKIKTYKPLLSELIDSVEQYVRKNKLKPVYYNVEIKMDPETDGIYHPDPEKFIALVMDVIKTKKIERRMNIQAFDPRPLRVMHAKYPKIKLAYLVGNGKDMATNIKELGFTPDIYSPHFQMVNEQAVKQAHDMKMTIIPWTVNDETAMKQLYDLGVDGIISDYPEVLVRLFGSYQSKNRK